MSILTLKLRLGGLALALGLLLQGCGGGGLASSGAVSTTTAASPSVDGTVSGFGSIIIDGIEFEDAKAATYSENADGSSTPTTLELGHRVRIKHDGNGTASHITIDAAVIGSVNSVPLVSSTDSNAYTLSVAGQIIKVNIGVGTTLPTTYFGGGYTVIGDVKASDVVEVHGSPVYNTTTKKYEIQATRLHKRTDTATIRIMGTIEAIDTTAKTFMLNSVTVKYESATLRPSTATLANGQTVIAFATNSSALSGTTLTATSLRVYSGTETLTPNSKVQIAGVVSNYSSSAGTFSLQGQTIKVGNVTPTPASASISNNTYVVVNGTLNATSGQIDATTIKIREQNTSTDLAKIKLIGPISSYDSATKTMVVRSVPVDIGSTSLVNVCNNPLADALVVTVEAQQQTETDVVLATSIRCAPASGTVIEAHLGTPSNINTTAKTLTLAVTTTTGSSTKAVRWTDLTAFKGVSAGTLNTVTTATLLVDGYVENSVLVARSIRLLSNTGGDRFMGGDKGTSRSAYRDKKKLAGS